MESDGERERERERENEWKKERQGIWKKSENRAQAEDDKAGGISLLFWGQIRNGVLLL